MAESRSDSLAAELKRRDLFDEYFAWHFTSKPSMAMRIAWLRKLKIKAGNRRVSQLHQSPEASAWRMAEAANAMAAMEARMPANIDAITRKALLDARFNEVIGQLSHRELMDHLRVEHDTAMLQLKKQDQELKKQDIALKLRRLELLERQAEEAKAAVDDSTLSAEEQTRRIREIFKR